jgi:3-methyl-2-oxobutanoate hydroxymethyltransferase
MERIKVNIETLKGMKARGEKISFLTAYDYPFASLQDRAGIDMILVGDSLGMTVLGYSNTLPVTMEDMVRHSKAVSRAAKHCFLIGDMPYMSYQPCQVDAIKNAGRFMSECGMDAVKLEGGRTIVKTIEAMVNAGIPVMGHIGMTPQFAAQWGGYKVRGKDAETAHALLEDAKAIEEAGAFAILLECVPASAAKIIYENLNILTLGIGAGPHCDGQLLIMHDVVGLFEAFTPKFVKRYAELGKIAEDAFRLYNQEVKDGTFPAPEHFYHMEKGELSKITV